MRNVIGYSPVKSFFAGLRFIRHPIGGKLAAKSECKQQNLKHGSGLPHRQTRKTCPESSCTSTVDYPGETAMNRKQRNTTRRIFVKEVATGTAAVAVAGAFVEALPAPQAGKKESTSLEARLNAVEKRLFP